MKDIAYNLGGFLHLFTWKDYLILLLVFLIVVLLLVIYYLIKVKDLQIEKNESVDQDLDLNEISRKIEQEEPKSITLTDYEEEQEDKAIISYQELLDRNKRIGFEEIDDEYQNFEVKIKKINFDETTKTNKDNKVNKSSTKISMISDEKETDFLDALKKLQNKLSK